MLTNTFDRIVIGGGLFGVFASLVLSRKGLKVCLLEQDSSLLRRASLINQARLHTGLHYPRSLDTALESIRYYEEFRSRYPTAVRDFHQVYAISKYNSKTSSSDFRSFIHRLGIDVQEISPNNYFNSGTISSAFRVTEPSFDTPELARIFTNELEKSSGVTVLLNSQVTGGTISLDGVKVNLSNGTKVFADGIVISSYAGINSLRNTLGLELLPLTFEIADVYLGKVETGFKNLGFTVMDGPFWSLMPFGHSDFSSLTSVGLTPIDRSHKLPIFSCQEKRNDCSPIGLADCTNCNFRPQSNYLHILQQVSLHLKGFLKFSEVKRLTTVKTVLDSSEVDDSRPTLIKQDMPNVSTIFSGKITTIFDVEEKLN
jgi:hypothetical protein